MTTTTAAPVTGASTLITELETINACLREVAGVLPDPSGVTVYSHSHQPVVHLLIASLDDLCQWAGHLEVPVTSVDDDGTGYIHHTATATRAAKWGVPVRFELAYLEPKPKPLPAETYSCDKCGSSFGIAGGTTGTPEDLEADDYFRSEVERHESGECVAAVAR